MTDIERWLTPEQESLQKACESVLDQDTQPLPESERGVLAGLTIAALEHLARRAELLDEVKEHLEFAQATYEHEFNDLDSCNSVTELLEQLAADLDGLPRGG